MVFESLKILIDSRYNRSIYHFLEMVFPSFLCIFLLIFHREIVFSFRITSPSLTYTQNTHIHNDHRIYLNFFPRIISSKPSATTTQRIVLPQKCHFRGISSTLFMGNSFLTQVPASLVSLDSWLTEWQNSSYSYQMNMLDKLANEGIVFHAFPVKIQKIIHESLSIQNLPLDMPTKVFSRFLYTLSSLQYPWVTTNSHLGEQFFNKFHSYFLKSREFPFFIQQEESSFQENKPNLAVSNEEEEEEEGIEERRRGEGEGKGKDEQQEAQQEPIEDDKELAPNFFLILEQFGFAGVNWRKLDEPLQKAILQASHYYLPLATNNSTKRLHSLPIEKLIRSLERMGVRWSDLSSSEQETIKQGMIFSQGSLTAMDIASIVLGMGKMSSFSLHKNETLFKEIYSTLYSEIDRLVSTLDSRGIKAIFLGFALSKASVKEIPEDIIKKLFWRLATIPRYFKDHEIADLIWGFGELGFCWKDLPESIQSCLKFGMHRMQLQRISPVDLSHIIIGFAKMQVLRTLPEKILNLINQDIIHMADKLSGREVANVLYGHVLSNFTWNEISPMVKHKLLQRVVTLGDAQLNQRDVIDITNSLGHLGARWDDFPMEFHNSYLQRIRNYLSIFTDKQLHLLIYRLPNLEAWDKLPQDIVEMMLDRIDKCSYSFDGKKVLASYRNGNLSLNAIPTLVREEYLKSMAYKDRMTVTIDPPIKFEK